MSFSNLWGMFLRSSNRNGCSCPERLHKTRKLRLETDDGWSHLRLHFFTKFCTEY